MSIATIHFSKVTAFKQLVLNSTTVYSVSEIGKYTLDGYDDENAKLYIPTSDFLGDGTIFVLNKTSGDVGEYDHETGEVMLYGDFEAFLAAVMEYHCQDYEG